MQSIETESNQLLTILITVGVSTHPLFPSHEVHLVLFFHRALAARVNEPWSPYVENCSGTPRDSSGQNCSVPTHFSLWSAHPLHWFGWEWEKQTPFPECSKLLMRHMCHQILQMGTFLSETCL